MVGVSEENSRVDQDDDPCVEAEAFMVSWDLPLGPSKEIMVGLLFWLPFVKDRVTIDDTLDLTKDVVEILSSILPCSDFYLFANHR